MLPYGAAFGSFLPCKGVGFQLSMAENFRKQRDVSTFALTKCHCYLTPIYPCVLMR